MKTLAMFLISFLSPSILAETEVAGSSLFTIQCQTFDHESYEDASLGGMTLRLVEQTGPHTYRSVLQLYHRLPDQGSKPRIFSFTTDSNVTWDITKKGAVLTGSYPVGQLKRFEIEFASKTGTINLRNELANVPGTILGLKNCKPMTDESKI